MQKAPESLQMVCSGLQPPLPWGPSPKGQARLVRSPHRLCREGPLLSFLQGKGLRAPQVFSVTWGGWEKEGRE